MLFFLYKWFLVCDTIKEINDAEGETMIFEKAPAKINLTLDVLYKRDDGYHEIEMIMTSIDLADRLTFEKTNDRPSRLFPKKDTYQMINETLLIKGLP